MVSPCTIVGFGTRAVSRKTPIFFILYLKVNNFLNQETVCVFSAGKMYPQMLLTHFVVFRQNVEAVVWVSLRHSSLDSTGEQG